MWEYKISTGDSCWSWEWVRMLLKGNYSYCQVVSNVNSALLHTNGRHFFFLTFYDDAVPDFHLREKYIQGDILCIFCNMIFLKAARCVISALGDYLRNNVRRFLNLFATGRRQARSRHFRRQFARLKKRRMITSPRAWLLAVTPKLMTQ